MKNLFSKYRLALVSLLVITVALVSFFVFDVAAASMVSTSVFFGAVLWECGAENIAGFEGKILFYPDCITVDKPVLPKRSAAATLKDLVTATGAFTLKDNHKPIYVYCTDDTVGYKVENQGETDGQSFKISGEFFHPGNSVEVAAYARQVNNMRGSLVLQDREGKQFVVFNARIKPSCDLGKAPADRRGYSFTFEASSVAPQIELATPIDMDAVIAPDPEEPVYTWTDATGVTLFTTTVTPLAVGVAASANGVFTLANGSVVTVAELVITTIVPA